MDKKIVVVLLCSLLVGFSSYAQKADPIVIKLAGESISRSQLEEAYKKNNDLRQGLDKESIHDFVQSYIDFKLNVKEAKSQHMDTISSYIRDLSSARVQLSRKYMENMQYEDDYVLKIYNRTLEDIEVNHVLLPFADKIVFPSDTVSLYNKAIELRKKLLKDGFVGEGYEKPGSQATSLIIDNERRNGYIGWTVPFLFSTKIENAIYSLPINEISQPIRTPKGYHIIQVLAKRPARGAVELDQVVFTFPNLPPQKHQIDSVGKIVRKEYANKAGVPNFQSLCDDFSRVHKTGDNGCYFGIVALDSPYPPSFLSAAFNLKNIGDISDPILTDYGYHIIRLLNKLPAPSFSSIKESLRGKIVTRGRTQDLTLEKRNKMLSYFDVYINKEAYGKLNNVAQSVSPQDSIFLDLIKNKEDIIYSVNEDETYKVEDFLQYIHYRQDLLKDNTGDAPDMMQYVDAVKYTLSTDILQEYFDSFLFYNLTNYYYSTLEDRYPELKKQMTDISEELLSFAVKNKNVWERSKTDELGLAEYFNLNKNKYALDGRKYKGIIIYAKDESSMKKAEALAKNEKGIDVFIQKVKSVINKDASLVQIEKGLWSKGENQFVDNKIYGGGIPNEKKDYPYFTVIGRFIDKPEDFRDVRNVVELDYQNKVEQEWVAYLRNQYKVELESSVLNTIE